MSGMSGLPEKIQCKAYVNLDCTGTLTIRDSENISSVADDGVGQFTVNIDQNMNNANYAVSISTSDNNDGPTHGYVHGLTPMTSYDLEVTTVKSSSNAAYDCDHVTVAMFQGR